MAVVTAMAVTAVKTAKAARAKKFKWVDLMSHQFLQLCIKSICLYKWWGREGCSKSSNGSDNRYFSGSIIGSNCSNGVNKVMTVAALMAAVAVTEVRQQSQQRQQRQKIVKMGISDVLPVFCRYALNPCIPINGGKRNAGKRVGEKERMEFSHPLWMLH